MSLINEALKKAQNQRTNPPASTTPPGSPPPPATAHGAAPEPSPSPFSKVGVLVAICAVIVSVSVLGTVFLLRRPESPAVATNVVGTPRSASPDTAPQIRPSVPAVSPAIAPVAAPAAIAAVATASQASTPGAAPSTASSPGVSTMSAPAAIVAVTPPAPTAPPEPTPVKVTVRIQGLVDKFRISGIRLSDTDSKVILNDHLFHVDDPVESSLGLRLTKIEEHRLTFVDADGNSYVKRF